MKTRTEKREPLVLLFGGTVEGRRLAEILVGENQRVLLSVATDYGRQVLGPQLEENPLLEVHSGRLNREEIVTLLRERQPELVIDSTHPYAWEATENIRQAAEQAGIRCLRCLRPQALGNQAGPEGEPVEAELFGESVRVFSSTEQAARWLAGQEGNILVTTGSKELCAFQVIPGYEERVYARVLPSLESIGICLELGLKSRHVIGMQGPFSEETNASQLKEFQCAWLVTKDTGSQGGFAQKVRGAGQAGASVLVISRPVRETGLTEEEIIQAWRHWREHER